MELNKKIYAQIRIIPRTLDNDFTLKVAGIIGSYIIAAVLTTVWPVLIITAIVIPDIGIMKYSRLCRAAWLIWNVNWIVH